MKTKEIHEKSKFSQIFSKAIETLPFQRLRIYHLYLLGWRNIEIAEELQIPAKQVSLLLYHARKQIKDFIQKNYGYSIEDVHQAIISLQKENPEQLSDFFFLKYSITRDAKQEEQKIEPLKKIELIGEVKDACIQAGYENKDIFRVAELLEFPFSDEEKSELREQLEEYKASQEGFEKLVSTQINFETIREEINLKPPDFPPTPDPLWETAIRVLKSVAGSLIIEWGTDWKPVFAEAHLPVAKTRGQDVPSTHEKIERRRLTKGVLAGAEVEITPANRLVIRLKRRPSEGSQLRFVDKEGQIVELPVIQPLDRFGQAIYDLADISELPPFELEIQEP